MVLQAERDNVGTLADVIDRLLDKGLVINADITVTVVGVELLVIKIRAALASFETAARYGLEFPSGTTLETSAWRESVVEKEACPECRKRVSVAELMDQGCPWCGWVSAKAKMPSIISGNGHQREEIPPITAK